jgi:hypothetical protein
MPRTSMLKAATIAADVPNANEFSFSVMVITFL